MKTTNGNYINKVSLKSFILHYIDSKANYPKDMLVVRNKIYEIKPGFKIKIYKGDKFSIISNDPKSLRIYKKKNIINFNRSKKINSKSTNIFLKSIFPSFIIGFTQGIPKSVFGIIFNLLFSMLNIKLNFWEKLISGVTDFLPKSLIRIMIISVDIPFYKNSYKNKMIIIQFLVILVLYFISLEFNYLITNSITESISPISLKILKTKI